MPEPHWVTYLAALLTPTIAVLGSIIAYRQWRTAQHKLKLELFDRRFSVYDAARNFIGSIMRSGKATNEELFKFLAGTRTAKWLLDEDIDTYFEKELWKKAVELQALDSMLEGVPVGDERTTNVRKQSEIKKWIAEQYKVLDAKFEKYLRLEH